VDGAGKKRPSVPAQAAALRLARRQSVISHTAGMSDCCNHAVFLVIACSGIEWGVEGVMFWRGVLLTSALLLSGCVSDRVGTDYAAISQKVGPPKPGQSRIVVLQEKRAGLSMAFCACDLKLDGSPIGKVVVGTYLYADRPAGRHQLSATEVLFPGETRRDITMESGRTYFFLVRSSERHDAVTGVTMIGGLAGAVVASVATSGVDNTGPANFFPLDEPAARTTLAELQLAE
jgi:hypothetical protein